MRRPIVIIGLLLLSCRAFAEPDACADLSSTAAILRCGMVKHPQVQLARLDHGQAEGLVAVAAQRLNPEVNSQTTFSRELSNQFYTQLNFAHTFELGGKRTARVDVARADSRLTHATENEVRLDVYLAAFEALIRLRQIAEETAALDDALRTFGRIDKEYRARPRLNPEQRASASIFDVARQEYLIRRGSLQIERDQHLRTLEITVGRPITPDPSSLPQRPTAWPPLEPGETEEALRVRRAHAEMARAESDLRLARSAAWPDLKIGPTVMFQRQNGVQSVAYGVNFALPLPLFHHNAAGSSHAALGLERRARALAFARAESIDELAHLRWAYETAVRSLETLSSTDLGRKHGEIEVLFDQGVVSGTSIVEIHRQISDLTKTRNAQELVAVLAAARHKAMTGRLPEVLQ